MPQRLVIVEGYEFEYVVSVFLVDVVEVCADDLLESLRECLELSDDRVAEGKVVFTNCHLVVVFEERVKAASLLSHVPREIVHLACADFLKECIFDLLVERLSLVRHSCRLAKGVE